MSKIALSGDASGTGTFTIASPNSNSNYTLTLPTSTGTMALLQTPSFATTIGVGGATPATTGAGITFPATQSASSDANTLDDYEEGSWTPTIQGGTTGGTTTYTSQAASYVKIGKVVHVTCDLAASSTTGTGQLRIGGLPFTSGATFQGATPCMVEQYNWSGGSYMQLYMGQARTYLVPYTMTDDGAWAGQNMTNEQQNFIFTATYWTD
jgi:hypothetical protein